MILPFVLIPCALANAAIPHAAESGSPEIAALSKLFVDGCLNGKLLLPAGSRPTKRGEGDTLSKGERVIASYRLATPVWSVLSVGEYDPPNDKGWTRVCQIRASIFDLRTAWRIVSSAVLGGNGAKYIPNSTSLKIDNPVDGYEVSVTQQFLFICFYDAKTTRKRIALNRTDKPVTRAINWDR